MKRFALVLTLLITIQVFPQGEANFWYFGKKAGIDFNNGSVTPITGSLSTNEGCSSFSDKNGNLLFYSDGINVWNSNNQVMPNGSNLMGDPSSTQSAIIVPHPGNTNLFYIFTVGANNYDWDNVLISPTKGLNCYTVDMTLDSGFGDVVGSNIDLSIGKNAEWTEKITSVKGADCNTFWVISLVNNTFISYKIDINGLNTTAISSTVNYNASDPRGYLKVSPDGKKLVSATYGTGKVFLYTFDDSTGKVKNDGISLIYAPEIDGYTYGVEFSPNSTKLYCSTFNGENSNKKNKLFQFDLQNPNIISSKFLVKSQTGYRGALQLGPNGKIYITVPPSYDFGTSILNAINNPDKLGADCNYEPNAIDLGTNFAMQGLPPFIASLLLPVEISDNKNNQDLSNTTVKRCVGENYILTPQNIPGNPICNWSFNNNIIPNSSDGLSLELQNLSKQHAGTYFLEIETIDECGFPTIYKGEVSIEVFDPPVISNGFVYDQCDIDNNSTDGITQFNLTTKIEEITLNDPNLEVLFFQNQTDLDSNTPILNSENYTSSTNPNILIKLTNKFSGCFTTGKIKLNVYPTSLDLYENYYECENDISSNNSLKSIGNGIATFNFEVKRLEIETLFSDPSIEVEFYQNTTDAQLQINALKGIINFPSKEIIVRISNKLSKNCISMGKFDLVINPIPIPKGSDEVIILCVSNPRDNPQLFTSYLDGETIYPDDTYQWYFNNNSISGATNYFYEANTEGVYKVEVTHKYENNLTDLLDDTYCKGYNTFKIIESNPPLIQIKDITIQDDSNNNSISISSTNLGLGEYEYSLIDSRENVEFTYQKTPFFNNVSAGIHTILIKDKKCGIASMKVSVIGYQKFFTPNGDGQNDTWKVLGVNENFYASSNIYIYDRYGKLITKIDPKGNGWDGTFKGTILPSSDYWFFVELVDTFGETKIKKGHFSLIRR